MSTAAKSVTTKTGVTVTTCYCRKCMQMRAASYFYEAYDNGLIDTNGQFSVCKDCVQKIYDELFERYGSIEQTLHRMCTSLNVRYSNVALEACKTHVATLLSNGKNVTAIFAIYLMKLTATNPSMDKSALMDNSYQDLSVIFVDKMADTKKLPIPQDVVDFWGKDYSRDEVEYLESQYAGFKKTHKADTYTEIVLLQQVCYTLLQIKKMRTNGDDTDDILKTLMNLMGKLAITPDSNKGQDKEVPALGMWIKDVETMEPCQWLKSDPRGDMYRDVGNVEEYSEKYIVRPLKNYITGSKDFNVGDDEDREDLFSEDISFEISEEDEEGDNG